MKNNSKGFTLVELLVTVVLLGIVATIIVINMTHISTQGQDKEYEQFREYVISAATTYSTKNPDVFSNLYIDKSFMYITTGDLIYSGELDENTINPYTKERIGKDEKIKAVLDTSSGALKFEYPAENNETEQFLVALDDYVINGEPYDCMTGIGTYKLALSDEDGNLITDKNKLINDYNFTCEYDSSWQKWNDDEWFRQHGTYVLRGTDYIGDKDGNVMYTPDSGTYRIKYTYITDSGISKTFYRNVIVLEQFEPAVDLRVVSSNVTGNAVKPTVSSETFAASNNRYTNVVKSDANGIEYGLFTPSVSNDCSTWTHLAFKVTLPGADVNTARFTVQRSITGTGNYPASAARNSQTIYDGNNFDQVFVTDDGEIAYDIKTITSGHYFPNYKLESKNRIIVKQDLIVGSCKITGGSQEYTTGKTINIADTYSPKGVVAYEFSYGKSDRTVAPVSINEFSRTGTVTSRTYTTTAPVVNKTCPFVYNEHNDLYIRAINSEGYYGEWTRVDLYITNRLYNLMAPEKARGACINGGTSGAYGALDCHYNTKQKYIKYNDIVFNIIGRTTTDVLIADHGHLTLASNTYVSRGGTWGTQTCDGYYSTNYTYTQANFAGLKNAVATLDRGIFTCNYGTVFRNRSIGTGNQGSYYGYSAIPTPRDVSLFGNALDGDFWLSQSGSGGTFQICVHGSWCTSKENYYMMYKRSNGTYSAYGGSTGTLKTMHSITNGIVCQGDGSAGNPYVIATNC